MIAAARVDDRFKLHPARDRRRLLIWPVSMVAAANFPLAQRLAQGACGSTRMRITSSKRFQSTNAESRLLGCSYSSHRKYEVQNHMTQLGCTLRVQVLRGFPERKWCNPAQFVGLRRCQSSVSWFWGRNRTPPGTVKSVIDCVVHGNGAKIPDRPVRPFWPDSSWDVGKNFLACNPAIFRPGGCRSPTAVPSLTISAASLPQQDKLACQWVRHRPRFFLRWVPPQLG